MSQQRAASPALPTPPSGAHMRSLSRKVVFFDDLSLQGGGGGVSLDGSTSLFEGESAPTSSALPDDAKKVVPDDMPVPASTDSGSRTVGTVVEAVVGSDAESRRAHEDETRGSVDEEEVVGSDGESRRAHECWLPRCAR